MMGNGFGFGFPGLGMVLFWGLIILLVVWEVRSLSAGSTHRDKSARQLLDERFAKGEIDGEEYEQKKRSLG